MSSSSKTSRLRLNVWSANDSPMRADFNSDNALIDDAVQSIESSIATNTSDHAAIRSEFASGLSANASDHAAIRSEMSSIVGGASDELYTYARETRRLVLDAYSAALAAGLIASDPAASDVWVETFADLGDFDFSSSTTARYFQNETNNMSINYIGASAGYHPSLGDTYSRASKDNIALPFTLTESCSIRGLLARPVYSTNFVGDVNVTCKVYKATASGNSYRLGDVVFSTTKARPTTIPSNTTFTDNYVNYVDTPFTLSAGTYVAVFHGTMLRANVYRDTHTDGNPRLAPYDRLFTLPDGNPANTLAVTTDNYADAAVHWAPTASPYGYLNTKMLGFNRTMKSVSVYVYCDTDDLQCTCSASGASGASTTLTLDERMRNAPALGGLYVTKLSGTLASALSDVKLRLGLYSPSLGRIKRIQLIAASTEG